MSNDKVCIYIFKKLFFLLFFLNFLSMCILLVFTLPPVGASCFSRRFHIVYENNILITPTRVNKKAHMYIRILLDSLAITRIIFCERDFFSFPHMQTCTKVSFR